MNNRWIWIGVAMLALGLIIWVLVTMLFGNVKGHLYDSINAEAQVQLSRICELEGDYKAAKGTYTQDLEGIGFYQGENDGSKFVYEVGIADSGRFVARAFAVEDYDRDQVQLTWEISSSDCIPRQLEED
jgi:type IV pilus assembly protein PilE